MLASSCTCTCYVFPFPLCVPLIQIQSLSELTMAYKESLDKHGSVLVKVTQCIFIGSSAVGKSSLKHLLVHNTPKTINTSTAVMDTPEVVSYSSEQYAVDGDTTAWQLVDDDVMGKSLYECITSKAYNEDPNMPQVHDNAYPQRISHVPSTSSELVTSLLQKKEEGCGHGSIKLKGASFIHLLDTGGQPSFQDALPLLLHSPCTYIQVFNAARNLDQPVPITFRHDGHTVSLPDSNETGWKMMLRSFSSIYTMSHKCSKELASFQPEGRQSPQFRIFVVGTFKDRLVGEGRHEEAAHDISERLGELKGKPYYCYIKKDPAGQPFYLINNRTVMGDEGAYLKGLRRDLSDSCSSLSLRSH